MKPRQVKQTRTSTPVTPGNASGASETNRQVYPAPRTPAEQAAFENEVFEERAQLLVGMRDRQTTSAAQEEARANQAAVERNRRAAEGDELIAAERARRARDEEQQARDEARRVTSPRSRGPRDPRMFRGGN